jgi:hypothetical protein
MRYAIITPFALCQQIEQSITNACIADNKWIDGITTGYGLMKHATEDKGCMKILPGYEEYFKPFEDQLQYVSELPEDWFPKIDINTFNK